MKVLFLFFFIFHGINLIRVSTTHVFLLNHMFHFATNSIFSTSHPKRAIFLRAAPRQYPLIAFPSCQAVSKTRISILLEPAPPLRRTLRGVAGVTPARYRL